MQTPLDDNPFDLLQLDPRHTPRELTELLRRRAERATPAERAELQRLWRQLTLKESDRIRWALLAHPRNSRAETRHIQALQEKIPPFVSRYQPPPLTVTLQDLITTPAPTANPSSTSRAQLFEPPIYQGELDDG